MHEQRPVLTREVTIRGPKFFREGSRLMFVYNYDSSTRDGPRPATAADKEAHADAYQAHLDELHAPGPFAHFKPVIEAKDPPGGRPPPETGEYAKRRAQAAEPK
jgi:hypothetical protein